jgi:hypothetical protein
LAAPPLGPPSARGEEDKAPIGPAIADEAPCISIIASNANKVVGEEGSLDPANATEDEAVLGSAKARDKDEEEAKLGPSTADEDGVSLGPASARDEDEAEAVLGPANADQNSAYAAAVENADDDNEGKDEACACIRCVAFSCMGRCRSCVASDGSGG